jgi:hypothetical protein
MDTGSAPRRRLLLCAPRHAAAALAELGEAWRERGIAVDHAVFDAAAPDVARLVRGEGSRWDAALLVASPRRAPATALPAPFADVSSGRGCTRRVPLAWLPAASPVALGRFAAAAARVHRRAGTRRAVALLGQWLPPYLRVTERMQRLVGADVRPFRWTGDALTREDMVGALGCGLGLALYVGHGRPMGWVGYHGVRAHHFEAGDAVHGAARRRREPLGAILSLCCRTASRRRVGTSYAEALPLLGVAAASFGAVGDTLHSDNTRWAVGVCDALAGGAQTVGELLVRAAPASPTALESYRLIGDPFAPLLSEAAAVSRAARVRVHA